MKAKNLKTPDAKKVKTQEPVPENNRSVQLDVGSNLATITFEESAFEGLKVEVTPDGNVTAYTSDDVKTRNALVVEEAALAGEKAGGTEASIGTSFNSVSIFGATIETNLGALTIHTNGKVFVKPLADFTDTDGLVIGQSAEDGWTYVGKSPSSGKPLFVAPEDAGVAKYRKIKKILKAAGSQGHPEARLPTKEELSLLFKAEANVNGLVAGDKSPGYWSSTESGACAWAQKPGNKKPELELKKDKKPIRLVRN